MKNIKKVFIILSVLICILILGMLFSSNSFAANENEKIQITSKINGVSNIISNKYILEIVPDSANKPGAVGEPKQIEFYYDYAVPNLNNEVILRDFIDFSGTTYNEPGVYKYIVKEISSTDINTFPISNDQYEISVLVELDINTGLLKKTVSNQAKDLNDGVKKKLEINHQSVYTNIYVENYVRGAIANPNQYFKYKFSINGTKAGDVFTVSGQDSTVVFNGEQITTTNNYTVQQEEEENFIYIYLRADQIAVIGVVDNGQKSLQQIPISATFKLSSVESRKFSTTINNVSTKNSYELATVYDPNSNRIIIIQEQDFDVAITGAFMNIFPFIVLIIIVVMGFIFTRKFRLKDAE